ncbi:hypothetical protein CDD83_11158 [Cordyceps sp. RAO-2017]|nr:hypothetical protein CDD83_11158 [Cordyceps sp. RAO-2017]
MLGRFVALMERRGWLYDLPPDCLGCHRGLDEHGTPPSAAARPSPDKKKAPKAPGKENRSPRKRATVGDRALLRGKPVTRDILNELTNGAYRQT